MTALADQIHDAGGYVDVHLMVERPERHIAAFAGAGADGITIHFEATPHANYALAAVRDAGCRAGLALNPGTPAEAVRELVEDVDLVLCMTVNPGWGGQKFLPGSLGKLGRLRGLLYDGTALEVDGGIDAETARPVRARGRDGVRRGLRRVRRTGPGGCPPRRSRTPRATEYGQPYGRRISLRPQSAPRHVPHRPHRRRPPVLPGERAHRARGRRLRGRG